MRVRIVTLAEKHLLQCIHHGVWGSTLPRFKNWKKGDLLVFSVNRKLAALAEVAGKSFESEELVWDNGVFPHRIPIRFSQVLSSDSRIQLAGDVRDVLVSAWGPKYGWGILAQQPLEGTLAMKLIELVRSAPNGLEYFKANLAKLSELAK